MKMNFFILILLGFLFEESFSQSFDTLAAVLVGDKWGYINPHGVFVISPQFTDAEPFSEGLASVKFKFDPYKSREDWEAWNRMFPSDTNTIVGQFFAHMTYERWKEIIARDTIMPLALSVLYQKRGYIDPMGKGVFWTTAGYGGTFREGLAPYYQGALKMGYLNKDGTVSIPPIFDQVDSHFEGLACVSDVYGKAGYIDKSGILVIDTVYESAGRFSEGLAPVLANDMWGYIDHNGRIIIQPRFKEALSFSDGVAVAKTGAKYGFIDKVGRFVILPRFDEARSFQEGLAAVKEGGTWSYIDKDGKSVILISYDECSDFSQGLAAVATGDLWGYINTTGKLVIRLQYDKALDFSRVARENSLVR